MGNHAFLLMLFGKKITAIAFGDKSQFWEIFLFFYWQNLILF